VNVPDSTGSWDGAGAERLPREFFGRPALQVAPDLLGCVLWTSSSSGVVAVRLVEVEAYEGLADPASHAFRGRSARNSVMFGPPGHLYVYFTYGMHFCANLVCLPEGRASAVLLRAGEVVAGAHLAALRRDPKGNGRARANGRPASAADLARGPARLCQALDIDRSANGADACSPGGPVGIGPAIDRVTPAIDRVTPADGRGHPVAPAQIMTGPRVGVSQAADRPWRYWIAGDRHVSTYRASKPRPRKPVAGQDAGDGTILR
jgi:DNA-3-methyladenine glycosylase